MALTLRLLGGLTTAEIARAFLARSRRSRSGWCGRSGRCATRGCRSRCRAARSWRARLPSVLEVIYLVFNEGYAASAGEDWIRPALCEEALRLGRILAELAPARARGARADRADGDPGLAHAARGSGRDGEPVLLLDQDRSRWDPLLIGRGLAALERAEALRGPLGPYGLQAAIAACHARARDAEETDWVRIAALYDALAQLAPSPVVELNRAVALGMAFGPEAGLELLDRIAAEPALAGYHLLPSVRGDLLAKLGRRRGGRRRVRARRRADRERARARAAAQPGARSAAAA